MQFNAIISLIKSNSFDEAKNMLEKTRKQPQFQSLQDQALFKTLQVYFLTKDKKYQEALDLVPSSNDAQTTFLRAHLFLQLKKQKECVNELITLGTNVSLILRLAHNYKLLDTPEVKDFISKIVKQNEQSKNVDIKLLESLISIGQIQHAYTLFKHCDVNTIKNDKKILSLYLNLLAQEDLESANKIVKDLEIPAPSDLFPQAEQEGWNEEDCLRQLIDAAMPEKNKEKKTTNVQVKVAGGAEVFIPQKKKTNKRIKYPKDYDPLRTPDPERWLPKWQRSRFKKMAKKKGIYLKGAQGDAQIDTDVTSGNLKSTAHKEAVSGNNKRRKK